MKGIYHHLLYSCTNTTSLAWPWLVTAVTVSTLHKQFGEHDHVKGYGYARLSTDRGESSGVQ